jgi:hypothetical protein
VTWIPIWILNKTLTKKLNESSDMGCVQGIRW